MKVNVQYNDFRGTIAADISDFIGGNSLKKIAEHFELDSNRFRIVGLSIHGVEELQLDLRCVDLEKTTPEKEYIVDLNVDLNGENPLALLFKRLHISLHNQHDEKYLDSNLDSDEEGNLEEY